MKRVLPFNAKYFTGRTQSQQEILAGVGVCAAKYGNRAVSKTDCRQPVTLLQQDGRRRWVISGFCETHGTLTRDLHAREGVYVSWARLSDVMPSAQITSGVSK